MQHPAKKLPPLTRPLHPVFIFCAENGQSVCTDHMRKLTSCITDHLPQRHSLHVPQTEPTKSSREELRFHISYS